jgi:hypothetical protein
MRRGHLGSRVMVSHCPELFGIHERVQQRKFLCTIPGYVKISSTPERAKPWSGCIVGSSPLSTGWPSASTSGTSPTVTIWMQSKKEFGLLPPHPTKAMALPGYLSDTCSRTSAPRSRPGPTLWPRVNQMKRQSTQPSTADCFRAR